VNSRSTNQRFRAYTTARTLRSRISTIRGGQVFFSVYYPEVDRLLSGDRVADGVVIFRQSHSVRNPVLRGTRRKGRAGAARKVVPPTTISLKIPSAPRPRSTTIYPEEPTSLRGIASAESPSVCARFRCPIESFGRWRSRLPQPGAEDIVADRIWSYPRARRRNLLLPLHTTRSIAGTNFPPRLERNEASTKCMTPMRLVCARFLRPTAHLV